MIQVVFTYRDSAGVLKNLSVGFGLLRSLALGSTSPSSIRAEVREALLANNMLVLQGVRLVPTPRLYWQTGLTPIS